MVVKALPKTLSVPDAGRLYLGLGRISAYRAAARGDLPVIRVGGLLRVPVAALERLLAQVPLGITSIKDLNQGTPAE
jgi:hypothetical protein